MNILDYNKQHSLSSCNICVVMIEAFGSWAFPRHGACNDGTHEGTCTLWTSMHKHTCTRMQTCASTHAQAHMHNTCGHMHTQTSTHAHARLVVSGVSLFCVLEVEARVLIGRVHVCVLVWYMCPCSVRQCLMCCFLGCECLGCLVVHCGIASFVGWLGNV